MTGPDQGAAARQVDVAVIGAGFAGLGMACQLIRAGRRDFVVLERADEVGGTWRDNTYPGCACDIRSDLYSFSFAPNPGWRHRYARQPEIQRYLRDVVERFGLAGHLRTGHDVTNARWDPVAARWTITTTRGAFTARVLVAGHGPLIQPTWPGIPGLPDFAGERFHSARWNHDVDLRGKRIAVIGTGASAVQFVPELQRVAARLTVFQRTPPWITPRGDRDTSPRRRRAFARFPAAQRLARAGIFLGNEATHVLFAHSSAGRVVEWVTRRRLAGAVPDPALRAALTPGYRIGCKRILKSDDYYPALQQPNVELVTTRLARVEGAALVTDDGVRRTFDVVVAGTGFNATEPPLARIVRGADGRSLAEVWDGRMEALRGTAVAGFPNLFVLVGPNTALGHNSIVAMIEAQIGYILQALDHLDRTAAAAVEARADAQRTYSSAVQDALADSVWLRGGCTSYYLDARGRNTTLWPHRVTRFRAALRTFDAAEYLEHPARTKETAPLEHAALPASARPA